MVSGGRATRVTLTDDGPVLVAGPLEIELPDGSRVRSDRAVTALCTCKRSRRQPFCDTSHRRKVRTADSPTTGSPATGSDDAREDDDARPTPAR